ncbi:TrbG/VirB9 family P-type conjugative transfer protein [Parasphingopyxis lamellibrachiae]|uniref:Type IV secretion system protein VirB9 n=1 Tax=Parasphingopyxis lamellibrachiae TaxID=680125 RepID=A0A3D9F8I8_9SPHN|nr:TrbG/VirB9 family P-type conjugative transfer protein [Parasphingopyxis lamellibrachiae]RED12670.1 type IV secretion system protein VirB9 [Parasphingopyxis lamellibrachiae]
MKGRIVLIALLLLATPSAAQIDSQRGTGDWRLQTFSYEPEAVYTLDVEAGHHVAVAFAAGEQIQSIALGDDGAWEATPSGRGDMMFVKAGTSAPSTNMTVVTDIRTYVFGLSTGYGGAPWMVRFVYPATVSDTQDQADLPPLEQGRYRIRGSRHLRPIEIADDGRRTTIRWAAAQPMPAVFAEDGSGREAVVDGQVRDGLFVIDRVYSELIFRHGRRRVTARRFVSEQ